MKAKTATKALKKSIVLILAVILLLLGTAETVSADGFPVPPLTGEDGSIVITYAYMSSEGKVLIEGAQFAVYQVASLTVTGNQADYAAMPIFAEAGIDFNAMTIGQSIEVAAKLAEYAPRAEAKEMRVTNSDGKVAFLGLPPGMYLIMQTGKTGEAAKYTDYEPAIFSVPQVTNTASGRQWNYHLTLAPKTEIEKPSTPPPPTPPGLPKTSDPDNPYMWIGITVVDFAVLLLVIMFFVKSRKKAETA